MKFRDAFREARLASDKTYRAIGKEVGLSIGRLCDIEHGRTRPPTTYIVKKLEKALSVDDGRLEAAAEIERALSPMSMLAAFREKPLLAELVVAASRLDDFGLRHFIKRIEDFERGEG